MGKEKSTSVYVLGSKRSWSRIIYSGLYDLNAVMGAMNGFLSERKYVPVQREHSEAVKTSGREYTIEMAPFRNVTEYVQFGMQVYILIWRDVDVIVQENGKQVPLHKGDLELRFKAYMRKNYKSTFKETSKAGEFFRQTYEKYIIPGTLLYYEGKLFAEAEELMRRVKDALHEWRNK